VEVIFLTTTKVAASYFVLWFTDRQIFSLSNRFLFWEMKEKSQTVQDRENMEVAARVGFCVWLRNVAQVETSRMVRFRGGFANSLTTTFFVACGVLRRKDAA
jgi:hypothetical protein